MRATEIWQQVLKEFEPPKLDPSRREELECYIAKRKEQLGRNEPILEPRPL